MGNLPTNIEIIIGKYFSDEANVDEIKILENWVNHRQNREIFKQYAKANSFAIHTLIHDGNLHIVKKHISHKKPKLNYGIAASFIGLLMMGGFLLFQSLKKEKVTEDYLTVQLGNGDRQEIKNFEDQKITDKDGNLIASFHSGILQFVDRKGGKDVNLYVPAGKSISLLLPDKTSVRLNSASHFSFKEDFLKQSSRDVTLNGEAYFSVAKDKSHPFYVNTPRFTTRVLGTQFNVSSYLRDELNSVVLIEGSIAVNDLANRKQTILKPGEALNFSRNIKNVEKIENVSSKIHLAWLRNEIYFDNEPVHEILNKMERSFNIEIINNDPSINNDRFTGHFKSENLKEILETLKIAFECDYKIEGRKVTLFPENKP